MNDKLINFASILEDDTRAQAEALTRLPFVWPHIALMPDAHTGKGSSVGTVIPTTDALIPAAVGTDLGCGMSGVKTTLTHNDIRSLDLADLRARVESVIPMSPGQYNQAVNTESAEQRIADLEAVAARHNILLSHSPKWREQLGSLGGGNHFIELCLDTDDTVWLFLHSGSRGVGNKIAQRHIKTAQSLCKRWHINLTDPDHAYLPAGTAEFADYLRELNWAQKFAAENRAEMLDRFRSVFADWAGVDETGVEAQRILCHHNYTRRENVFGRDVWVTRKGAISARAGELGLIPGSMGTRSYVVEGLGYAPGLNSAPHGAGRRLSRTQARKQYTVGDLEAAMVGIEYRHGEEWVDEIPAAYKDISQVMLDAAKLVRPVTELRQIMNVKGT